MIMHIPFDKLLTVDILLRDIHHRMMVMFQEIMEVQITG